MRTTLSLDTSRIALLLVDFQEEQRQHPHYSVAAFDRVLANAVELLEVARGRHQLVVHAAYRRDFSLCPPRPFEPVGDGGVPAFSDAANPLTNICSEVGPKASEPVIYKNDASAFCEDKLQPILARHNIEWLVVAGVWTEACVAATVRDGIAKGFRILLVKDACGSGTTAMHETAVLNLANRLYGGAVTDTQRALALMAGKPAEAWIAERPVPILFDFANVTARYAEL
jgi:maleamate amidohydrolase